MHTGIQMHKRACMKATMRMWVRVRVRVCMYELGVLVEGQLARRIQSENPCRPAQHPVYCAGVRAYMHKCGVRAW